jgi:periplasmic glucans biosynthesis protein
VLVRHSLQIIAAITALLVSDASGRVAQTPQAPARISGPFSFVAVQKLAQELASRPLENRSSKMPPQLAKLGYDQFRDIRFKRENALWHDQALFEVQFFHRGFNFDRRVNISEVMNDGKVRPVVYSPALFDFGRLVKPMTNLPPDTGFAGFRVHFPLHTPAYKDELIVFLGASYFRVLGRNQIYGLSARGLAIDTGSKSGEEFPYFTDFWLVRPDPQSRVLQIYALLDSESVTGAYRFEIRPGAATQVEVSSVLYPRKAIEKLGIAPLTSMFLFGENPAGRRFDDFRPEVHDSDGLNSQTGAGEWLWRPLINPIELSINRFSDEHPRGFGLAQRDRDFAHYQDDESKFQRRPSYWVTPLGDWGKGGIELVEIPTDEEIHDNIVAYWVPSAPVEARKPLKYSYLLTSYSQSYLWPPGGRAIATRTGSAAVGGYKSDTARRVVVDFAGGDLDGLDPTQPVQATVTGRGGGIEDVTVQRLPETGAWRAAFRVNPQGKQPVDLRCYLTLYGEALTESWTYLLTP